MNDNPVFSLLLLLGLVLWVRYIVRRGKRRIEMREAPAKLALAVATERQAQEDVRVAAKYAQAEPLTDAELTTLSYFAVKSKLATPQQQQIVRLTEVLKVSAANLAEAEKQFIRSMGAKVDDCCSVFLFGDEFQSVEPMPRCHQSDLVMVLPSPDAEPNGVELFLGDVGPKLGMIRSSKTAAICREISDSGRKWAGFISSITAPTPADPMLVTVMLYRLTPQYWNELMTVKA